jgi:hypothetical protein
VTQANQLLQDWFEPLFLSPFELGFEGAKQTLQLEHVIVDELKITFAERFFEERLNFLNLVIHSLRGVMISQIGLGNFLAAPGAKSRQ